MQTLEASNPLSFFKALYRGFFEALAAPRDGRASIDGLLETSFDTFERNAENAPGIACHGGCASCCTIRVAATAPEVLLIARAIRSSPKTMEFELRRSIGVADGVTRRLDAQSRMMSGLPCPFIDHGLCVIYSVRPLACRGHASYDERACIDALAGHPCEVPISELHMTVRSLVQNAMQAALRDAGYAWGTYELNQALQIALTREACEADWLKGEDVFAAAAIEDVSQDEMAATFDAIKAQAA